MNNIIVKNELIDNEVKIKNMIFEIRGVQVILDSDLSRLFKVETGNLNKAMKRNIERFPEQFCFQLTDIEYSSLLFQIGRAKKKGGRTNLPYVYSEQGVAMISSLLHSDVAIKMSIIIINTFVAMRHFIIDNKNVYKSINIINNKLLEHDEKINYIFSKFDNRERLFLDGETFTAYTNILQILKCAINEIIAIDEYADIIFLDLIGNIKCKVILITRDSKRLSDIEINKYNKEYDNLAVIRDNSFHDRYFILDRKEIYLLGASINNIGDKTSMIIKLEDELVIETLLKKIDDIIKE